VSPAIVIRLLEPKEAVAYVEIRREALETVPLAFASSPEDDRGRSVDTVRQSLADPENQVIVGAFDGERLVGIAGVGRYEKTKLRHRAIIWGMYVRRGARGLGLGRRLLEAAVQQAGAWPDVLQVHISVTDAAPEARRLYESAGFTPWGAEPRALGLRGEFVTEYHMLLTLD
jgi:GNAT superfamily N-acetyltransferase